MSESETYIYMGLGTLLSTHSAFTPYTGITGYTLGRSSIILFSSVLLSFFQGQTDDDDGGGGGEVFIF